ncbi:hypothetical protein JCM19240_2153 [Vibrio maritimus]|uniref:Uncharacterized protein n=1 Tax=Vibrio maritimus TaxID=990268 RepID=A0A090TQR2_9VIBR|nr:hypothetical protein JCM19240_2153 [Vibrio maritimus]
MSNFSGNAEFSHRSIPFEYGFSSLCKEARYTVSSYGLSP